MKLHELNVLKQQDKIAKVFEDRLGQNLKFTNISRPQARAMLTRVRGLIHEHRSTPAFHYSEKNPNYLKLVMLEQGLISRLKEGTMQPGTVMVPLNTKDPKVQQTMQKAEKGAPLNPDEQKTITAIASQKTEAGKRFKRKRMVRESEIQQAQVVLAAQDMIDQIQKMLEQISEMQFKDLPALTDSIKNDMGIEQATAYQSGAAAALTQLLQSVQQGKTALEGAQGTLTGQAPSVPGDAAAGGDEMGMPAAPDAGAEMGGDELNPFGGDEEGTDELGNAASLGRDRRGVAESRKRVVKRTRR